MKTIYYKIRICDFLIIYLILKLNVHYTSEGTLCRDVSEMYTIFTFTCVFKNESSYEGFRNTPS